MMKLWRNRRASSEDMDTEIELTDVDLESGFGSPSVSHAAAFGRSAGEERRRLVRSCWLKRAICQIAMCSCIALYCALCIVHCALHCIVYTV